MKVVILAGGLGTRLSEETAIKPKPMVEVGEMPILWHIMKSYSQHGFNDFVICLGYKGHLIKEFFHTYALRTSSVRFDLKADSIEYLKGVTEPWKVTLVDTGESSMTGGRIKRIKDYVENEPFCLTYGDGVSDIDIPASIAFHKKNNCMVTLTAVQPPGRFGAISLASDQALIKEFHEKPAGDGAWINGGYFVCQPDVFDHIEGDSTVWEQEPLKNIARLGRLGAFRHTGFWHPMDTLHDKQFLDEQWRIDNAPWKTW